MKIPEYNDNVGIQNVGVAAVVSPDAAAAPWIALDRVGEATYGLGKIIQEKQDDILRVKDLSERTLTAEGRITDLMLDLEKERDPATAPAKFSEGMSQIKSDVLDGVVDYKVATALQSHLTSKEVSGVTQVKHAAWKWTLENNTASTNKSIDEWTKIAAGDETRIPEAKEMITDLIDANVRMGAWTPDAGRIKQDRAIKDVYAQTAAQIIIDDPLNAPDRISPLIAESELDPTEALALESRAVAAQARAERAQVKQDKSDWSANAANAAIEIKAGRMNKEGALQLYSEGLIGAPQLQYLEQVLGGSGADSKASKNALAAIKMEVYMDRMSPQVAMRKIYGSPDITPDDKDNALRELSQLGKADDKISTQLNKAKEIYFTSFAPSFLSLNPKAEERAAANDALNRMYTDYFANKKKYDADPEALIKHALEVTQQKRASDTGTSKYKSMDEVMKAFDYYKSRGMIDASGRALLRADWQKEFGKWGLVLNDENWPKGKP